MLEIKTLKRDKADIVESICDFLNINGPDMSSGSTVNSEVLDRIGHACKLDVSRELNSYRKFEKLLRHFGGLYDPLLDSSEHSASGGSTISTHGWKKLARLMGAVNFNFILNYAEHAVSETYSDVLGISYGFSDTVTGRVPLLEAGIGSRVVFYNTANSARIPRKAFIGSARVVAVDYSKPGEYRLELADYVQFTNPISKDEIQNVGWNHQHSMAEIDDASFLALQSEGIKKNLVTEESKYEDEFEIDIRPDAASLRIYRGMTFTSHYALGEFIDNSITSALQNKDALNRDESNPYKLLVDVRFDPAENCLIVTDNAAGIAKRNIGAALKAGATANSGSVGLGRYGVGMKAAAFWFGSKLEIETYPLGEDNGWRVILDIGGEGDVPATTSVNAIPHRGAPGTIIKVHNLWNSPKTTAQNMIRRYLPSIYRSFLGTEQNDHPDLIPTQIYFMGKSLTYAPPELLEKQFWASSDGPQPGAQVKIWKQEVEVTLDSGPKISGWVGILNKMSRDLSGLTLKYHGKVIAGAVPVGATPEDSANGSSQSRSYKPKIIFKQVGSKLDQSFVGEFDVSELGKTITTDDIRWTAEQEEDFANKLFAAISEGAESLLKMASNVRRRQDSISDPDKTVETSDTDLEERARGTLPGNVQHGKDEGQDDIAPDNEILDLDRDGKSLEVALTDDAGHRHVFELVVLQTSKANAGFFTLQTSEDKHTIAINVGHPVFDGILTTDSGVRRAIQSMALALGVSEVFADTDDGSILRRKFNYVIDTLGKLKQEES